MYPDHNSKSSAGTHIFRAQSRHCWPAWASFYQPVATRDVFLGHKSRKFQLDTALLRARIRQAQLIQSSFKVGIDNRLKFHFELSAFDAGLEFHPPRFVSRAWWVKGGKCEVPALRLLPDRWVRCRREHTTKL